MKIAVIHPAQQHSFQTATAFQKKEILCFYATSVYFGKFSWTRVISNILQGELKERASFRQSNTIPSEKIIQIHELLSLFIIFIRRLNFSKKIQILTANIFLSLFNNKIIKLLKKNPVDLVIVYDTWCYSLIKNFNKITKKPILILDMSAPPLKEMNARFLSHKINNISSEENIITPPLINPQDIISTDYEINSVDGFIVASNLVKNMLIERGVDSRRIILARYGTNSFPEIYSNQSNSNIKRRAKKLRVLFVGTVSFAKGAPFLFEAIQILSSDDFVFNFAGSFDSSMNLNSSILDKSIFHGHLSKSKLRKLYDEIDVLVFPSLMDGFGLSVLEACSLGVPVVCSKSAGVSEIFEHQVNGLLVSPGSSGDIVKYLNLLNADRKLLESMSMAAIALAEKYSWSQYHECLFNEMTKFIKFHNTDIPRQKS